MNGLSEHDLDRLILALFDDVISAEDHQQLQTTLLASQAARDRYLDLVSLHNLLELLVAAPMVVTIPQPMSVKGPHNQPLPRRPVRAKARTLPVKRPFVRLARRSMRLVTYRMLDRAVHNRPLLGTLAMLVLAATFLGWKLVPSPPVAKIASSRDSVLTISHPQDLKKPLKENTLGPGSSVELFQGTVELTFSSGVRGVFQAPETITLTDDRRLTLKRGAAWFHVPPKAVGFEVLTPHLQIVDLGTEFGVVSRADGSDEIHVLTGKVEASARHGATVREILVAGESRIVSTEGELTKIETKPDLFLTTLPTTQPYLHWTFDETDLNHFTTEGSHPAAGHVASKLVSPDGTSAFASTLGKFGQALSAPGKNGYLETDWPGIDGSAPRTVAYWLKLPPGQQCLHPVVGWGSRNLFRSFFSYIKTGPQGAVAALSCDTFWIEGSIPIDDGQWHHVAAVYTGRPHSDGTPGIYCYVDGRLDQMTRSEESNKPSRDSQGHVIVDTITTGPEAIPLTLFTDMYSDRKMSPLGTLSLAIDELHVFQSALTAEQVANLYQSNQSDPASSNSPRKSSSD